jgi:NodT family efflux transporter outer membrane factor (OMF) lipoprotein
MTFRDGFLLATLLATGACSVPNMGSMRQVAKPSDMAATQSFAAPERAWPSDAWWTQYGDPQLDSLVAEGLAASPDLRIAVARMNAAQAIARQTGSALYPKIAADGTVASEKQSYNMGFPREFLPQGWNDTGRATLGVNFDIDIWGRNRAALAAAKGEAEAARVDSAQARLVLVTGIATAYAELAGLYAQRDVIARTVEVRASFLDLAQQRVESGLDNQAPAELARAKLASARAELAALAESIGLVRNQLAALIGAGPDRGLSIERPGTALLHDFGLPDQLALDLIGRRPDIVSARFRVEAAARRVKVARADFYPNLNIMGLIGVQSLGIGNLTGNGSDYGRVGPALSLPIFSGGQLRGAYRQSRADYDRAVADYDRTLVGALRDVADAATSMRALAERQTQTNIAVQAAERGFQIAMDRYRGNLSTYLEALDAEDLLLQQRRADAMLKTRAFALDIQIVRGLGGGYADPRRPVPPVSQ